MIIYRVPPFSSVKTVTVPVGDHTYDWVVSDRFGEEVLAGTATSDSGGALSFTLPSSRYDADYVLEVEDAGNTVLTEPIFVVRPYGKLPTTPDEVKTEAIGRAIIDSVTSGFYFKLEVFETEGSGSDYLPIPNRINKLMRVWENGELVFTNGGTTNLRSFVVSRDRSSIVEVGDENLDSGKVIKLPYAGSDSYGGYGDSSGSFPHGVDYVVEYETGYLVVPNEVVQAAEILAVDVAEGDEYLSRYITEYDTDQYRVKFSSRVFGGTGNKTVDQLLKKFMDYNVRAGVI